MKKRGLLWGSLIGFTNGFFASGGGIIAVLLLKKFFFLEEKKAHATSILIILPLTLSGLFVYTMAGYFDFSVIIKCAVGASLGSLLGAKLLSKIPPRYIKMGFGAVMVTAAIKMIFGG